MTEWSVNKNPVFEPCVYTTGKSWVQNLDTAKANITAVSLNFCLIKLVKEQSQLFAIINLQFVESVAVLIINIHRSRAMK